MQKVPKVRLADPNVEPTDEELEALMQAVGERVRKENQRAHEQFLERMRNLSPANTERE